MRTPLSGGGDSPCYLRFPVCEAACVPPSIISAVVGPLAAVALMAFSSDNFRLVFWIAVVPAFISLAVILLAVEEPSRHAPDASQRLRPADAGRLSGTWRSPKGFLRV